jgi:hypothetical protein
MATSVKSIQDIKSELSAIVEKKQYFGEQVDLLLDLLGYAIHSRQVTASVLAIESNPDFATKVNSKIKLALDACYSVPRGTNCILEITLRRTSDKKLPKFTKIHSYQNYKVYTIEDIEPGIIGSTVTVKAIISTGIIQDEEPTPLMNSSHIITWSKFTNLSDTLFITDENGDKIKITEEAREHLDYGYPLILTDYDYSIRAMFKEKIFTEIDKYKLTAFPYCEYTPKYISNNQEGTAKIADMEDGFNRGISLKGFSVLEILIYPAVLRESISDITYISKYNLATLTRIRSIRDIERVFKDYFKYSVQDCYTKTDSDKNQVDIYYILKNTASRDITNLEWNLFKTNNIIRYIPCYFEKHVCSKKSMGLNITVKATEDIDKLIITDYLDTLNYQMNRTIRVSEIITNIAKLDSRIEYSEVILFDSDYQEMNSVEISGTDYIYFDDVQVNIES